MRIAIVGSGFGISGHLRAFSELPGVEVLGVADSGSGRAKTRLPKDVAYLPSWRDALDSNVDAVCVAVPPASQMDIVLAALERKKHVFCEKPFGMSLEEAENMVAASFSAGSCTTSVNFQFRFETGIQILKQQIESGIIGDLRSIDFSWITAGRADAQVQWTWRNDLAVGGGVIGAFFSHAADLIWWLAQGETRSVFGHTVILVKHRPDESGRLREVTAEDMVTAQLQLVNGVTASCRISNCQIGGHGMRIEVLGSEGVLAYRHVPPFTLEEQEVTLSRNEEREVVIPLSQGEQVSDGVDTRLQAVRRSASHFLRKARGDCESSVAGFADGLRVQRIMHGLRQSALADQNVILC